MLQGEHSAIRLTVEFIKLPFVIKIAVNIFIKVRFFHTQEDGPTALESDGPYFEIMGQ